MVFEYNVYFHHLFTWGLVPFIVGLMLIVGAFVPNVDKGILTCLVVLAAGIFFVYLGVARLKHGIPLLHEKEDAKIECVGEITSFQDTGRNEKNSYQGKTTFACYVFIDGEKYYIMYKGDLEIGDEVRFEYLPKSKIILSIDEIDTEQ